MTYRPLMRVCAFLILPIAFIAFAPEVLAKDLTLSVSNVTMVKAPPTCEVRTTKRILRSGGTMEIVWKSTRADYMEGMVKGDRTWEKRGRERIAIAVLGKHEFPLTFVGPGGKTTCIAKVFVHPRKDRK